MLFSAAIIPALLAGLAAAAPNRRRVGVQAHRGATGMRPENTLQAFAYSLEIGVDVLEMDCLFTKDKIVRAPAPARAHPR